MNMLKPIKKDNATAFGMPTWGVPEKFWFSKNTLVTQRILFYTDRYAQCNYYVVYCLLKCPATLDQFTLIWQTKNFCLQSCQTLTSRSILDITFLAWVICTMVALINDHNVIIVIIITILYLLNSHYICVLQILSIMTSQYF